MPLNDFSFYLDFGATHTKALVQSMSSQKTFSFLEPAPNLDKIENKRSYSPTDYSTHAVKIFTSLVKKFGIPKNIAISGQMATYVIVDENSEPITPIISWQDTSSLNVKNHDGIEIYTYAKNIIENREDGFRPGLPSVSLMAYLAEQKYALNQQYFYIPLTNFVLGSILEQDLTKLNVHVSEAHCSGLFSLREKDWAIRGEQREILKNLFLPKVEFNPRFAEDSKFGIRIFTPIGDQQAAIEGAQLGFNEIFVHLATGGQVVCRIQDLFQVTSSSIQIRPFILENEYYATVTHLPAGRIFIKLFEHLTKETGKEFNWKEFEEIFRARRPPVLHPEKMDVVSINQDLASFPQISEFANSVEDYVFCFVSAVVNVYATAVANLPLKGKSKIRLSGGLITRSNFLKEALLEAIQYDQISVSENIDTSLMGLRSMIKSVD
jgi:xylulokinase